MIKGWGFHWVGETLIFGNNFSNFGIQILFSKINITVLPTGVKPCLQYFCEFAPKNRPFNKRKKALWVKQITQT